MNYILSYDGFDARASHGYTLAWGISLNEKWGAFIEEYASRSPSFATYGRWLHSIDTGFSYLANNNLQYDIAFGVDIEDNFQQEYLALGFSWRKIP